MKPLSKHHGLRRYGANMAWMFAEQILRIIAGLLVGIWVARYLGPQQFGVFSYVLAFTAIFSGIAKLGLDGIVVRDLVKEPDKRDVYLGTAFWLKCAGALVTFGVIVAATRFTSNDATTNLYIFILASGMVFQSFEVIDFYFQSKVLSKYVSLCKIAQLSLSSLLKCYFVFTRAELFWFVAISLFDQITLALSLWIAYRYSTVKCFYSAFNIVIAKRLFKDSFPLMLSSFVVMIYMRSDQIMIKEMLGEREVGLYSAAVKLSEVWYLIPTIITNSVFPALVSAKTVSEEFYYARFQKLFALMVWIALGIALPMTFLSHWLVMFLYGTAYLKAGPVLTIHIWTGVFVFLGVASGSWFMIENLQALAFWRTFWGAAINVALNCALIPRYGVTGAAMSALCANFVAAFLFDVFHRKTVFLFYMKMKAPFCFRDIFYAK